MPFIAGALASATAQLHDGEMEGWALLSNWQKLTLLRCLKLRHGSPWRMVWYFSQYHWTSGGMDLHPGWECRGCGRSWVPPKRSCA